MADNSHAVTQTIGSPDPSVTYKPRYAVRVVAFNNDGKIAMLHAQRENYYKFPGGGIDPGEDHAAAIHREMMEETGCRVKVREESGCVAVIEEWRQPYHQLSYCYLADLIEEGGETNLQADEVEDGLSHLWMGVDEAKKAIKEAVPESDFGKSIRERDMYLLDFVTKSTA